MFWRTLLGGRSTICQPSPSRQCRNCDRWRDRLDGFLAEIAVWLDRGILLRGSDQGFEGTRTRSEIDAGRPVRTIENLSHPKSSGGELQLPPALLEEKEPKQDKHLVLGREAAINGTSITRTVGGARRTITEAIA